MDIMFDHGGAWHGEDPDEVGSLVDFVVSDRAAVRVETSSTSEGEWDFDEPDTESD